MALQRGLALVTQAVQYDTSGDIRKACELYSQSVEQFEQALLSETNPEMRMTIQRKMAEYRMRLNTLTALLPSGSNFNTLPAQSQSLPPVTPAEVKKQLNLRGPSAMDGSEAWSTANDLADRGKKADWSKDFEQALAYYQCAFDYYMRAASSEDTLTGDMKAKVRDQMKAFLDRAEQLKPYVLHLQKQKQMTPQRPIIPSQQQAPQTSQISLAATYPSQPIQSVPVMQQSFPQSSFFPQIQPQQPQQPQPQLVTRPTPSPFPQVQEIAPKQPYKIPLPGMQMPTPAPTLQMATLVEDDAREEYILPLATPGAATQNGRCAGCGQSMQDSIFALDKEWHPNCFIAIVKCGLCKKDFNLLDLRYQVKDNVAYHMKCFFDLVGLEQEEDRKFLLASGSLFVKVSMPKRIFKMENTANKKVTGVRSYLRYTETRREKLLNGEVRAEAKCRHINEFETQLDGKLPMVAGILRESVTYKIPDGLQTTQIEDLWLNRAYDFVVKYYGNKYVI